MLVTRGELRGVRKDGSEFPTEGSASLWKTSDGMFITTSIRDITERKAIETVLQESEHEVPHHDRAYYRLNLYLSAVTNLVYANPAAVKISGYTL